MKVLIVFAGLLAITWAAPRPNGNAEIIKANSKIDHDNYSMNFETSDGTIRIEEGRLMDYGKEQAIVVHGSYSWRDQHDGNIYTVHYIADDKGFHPSGDHLPTLPLHEK
ncbi:larval cuticle protein 65Ab1-like [Haematobia irritans]|uniref:larval cuticle protein 65Ab1-like n=1 Tax=Haematobia irritans TaxID=7368 RepID=UPI003F4F96EA